MNPHWECGRHSGIPDCCIVYFMIRWNNGIGENTELRNSHWNREKIVEVQFEKSIEYVRCPSCIENGIIVKIKECSCYDTEK